MPTSFRVHATVLSFACASSACTGTPANDLFGDPSTSQDAAIDAEPDARTLYEATPEASNDASRTDERAESDAMPPARPDATLLEAAAMPDVITPLDAAEAGADADADAGLAPEGSLPDVGPDRAPCGLGCEGKRVFVTSRALSNGGFGLGSIAWADAFCQASADAKNLGGGWYAWLSDSVDSPLTRFSRITGAYRLLDGTIVAMGWTGLTSGTLLHAIDMMESGAVVPPDSFLEVWTGTGPNGVGTRVTCGDWTNDTADEPYGDVGTVGQIDGSWSFAYHQFCDRDNIHLYCFEK